MILKYRSYKLHYLWNLKCILIPFSVTYALEIYQWVYHENYQERRMAGQAKCHVYVCNQDFSQKLKNPTEKTYFLISLGCSLNSEISKLLLSLKDQRANTLSFEGHIISVTLLTFVIIMWKQSKILFSDFPSNTHFLFTFCVCICFTYIGFLFKQDS